MNALALPRGAAERIAQAVRSAAADRVETGGFLLATLDGCVTVVALAGEKAIKRRQHLFAIGSEALDVLFDWTTEYELTVAAQWHSHRYDAFLSKTDLVFGLNVPGFRTTVIPNYDHPSPEPNDWGWWIFEDAAWRLTHTPSVAAEPFSVITFDQGGVR